MFEPDLLARFTTHLREAFQKALFFAIRHGRALLEPGDLFVGLLQEQGSVGSEILLKSGVSIEHALTAFGSNVTVPPGNVLTPDLSTGVKRLLEKAVLTAHAHDHKYIGTEHLLFAFLELQLPDIEAFLQEQGIERTLLREQVQHILRSTARFPNLTQESTSSDERDDEPVGMPTEEGKAAARTPSSSKAKALDVYARELTKRDIATALDPVIGRDEEIERVIEILCRRTKNNPLLLGEPGVGKTAIVEGLAKRIAAHDVPHILRGKRIYALDLALMVAGTMYRGEFEARLKQLVEEVRNDTNVILFIDEMHTMVGAGSTSGSMDAANILKPALARGEIRCIGATTWNEFKKHIEPDPALERRYQIVQVREPSREVVIEMLRGLAKRYEAFHEVTFQKGVLEYAVDLAARYLPDRHFPDKAIDLLDEAAARVNTKRQVKADDRLLESLHEQLAELETKQEDAVQHQKMDAAARILKKKEELHKRIATVEKRIRTKRKTERLPVTTTDIADVVARLSHVSREMILASERDRLRSLHETLTKTIMGQEQALRDVAAIVTRAQLGLHHPSRPKASFLFVGPSGVGKTELARVLAKEIFGKEDALVKFDMSEFAEGHSVSKMLGSPAGYVGYREGNRLSDAIRKHPHAVYVFDEFEKAHSDVQQLLLQGLEEGHVTDATGRPLSLRNAYIILTSNIGGDAISKQALGFDQSESQSAYHRNVREQVRERLRPELLSRLDSVVVFEPLQRDSLRSIARKEADTLLERFARAQKVRASVSDEAIEWLLNKGHAKEEGARAMKKLVEREMADLLHQAFLQKPSKRRYTVDVKENTLAVS